jgi:hypothetical protein
MKKLLGIFALAAAGTACQQTQPTQAIAAIAERPSQAAAPASVAEEAPAIPQFLAQHNLASLLQTVTDIKSAGGPHIYNGFFGPSHRRIEVVFTQVSRDEDRPNVYSIQGKNRYKGVITPFGGTLVLTQLVEQPHYSKRELAGTDDPMGYLDPGLDKLPMYTAVGSFVLREDSAHKNAGVFRGHAALDVYLDPTHGLRLASRTGRTLTRSGNAKFEGTWLPYGAASPKPVVWVEDIFSYGPHILNNFSVGERDPDFNPKYAKLGWNTYWTNDEWWTEGYRDTVRSAPLRRVLFSPPSVATASDSTMTD